MTDVIELPDIDNLKRETIAQAIVRQSLAKGKTIEIPSLNIKLQSTDGKTVRIIQMNSQSQTS